jgi:hypothetical protein
MSDAAVVRNSSCKIETVSQPEAAEFERMSASSTMCDCFSNLLFQSKVYYIINKINNIQLHAVLLQQQ